MFCSQCGHESTADERFCTQCGQALRLVPRIEGERSAARVHLAPGESKAPAALMVAIAYTLRSGVLSIALALMADTPYSTGVTSSTDLVAFLIAGLLMFWVAYGLWRRRKWGLALARVVYVVSTLAGVVMLSSTVIYTGAGMYLAVEIALDILVVVYLFRPQTKALFGEHLCGMRGRWGYLA